MRVLIGAILMSVAILSFCIVLLGARNPRRPGWASDGLIGNLYCPLLVSFGLVGTALFVSGLSDFSAYGITRLDLLIAAAILCVTAIGAKAMKVRTRLAVYEKQAAEAAEKMRSVSAAAQANGRLPDTRRAA